MASPDQRVPDSGDVNKGWKIIVMNVGLVTVPLIFVVLRLITRKFLSKWVWWDDWAILAALVSSKLTIDLQLGTYILRQGFSSALDSILSWYTITVWDDISTTLIHRLFSISENISMGNGCNSSGLSLPHRCPYVSY